MNYKNKEWLNNMYNQYGSSYIAKLCEVDDSTIIYWLKKFNIKIRTRKESINMTNARKHKLNESYFKNIDSREKAYWLGLLMADGTMREYRENKFQLSLELKEKDKYIIDLFNNAISSNYKVSIASNTHCHTKRARLIITNNKFSQHLLEKGIVPNKTGKEIFPDIQKEFYRDFIRGFFDGDGSIQFTKNNRVRSKFHLVSCSKIILNRIKEVLELDASVNFTEKSFHTKSGTDHIYELETSTLTEIAKIYDYLYYDNCICLKRKEYIFKEFLSYYKTSARLIKRYSPTH